MSDQQPPQQMGHGVKQRDLTKMTPDEVDSFLHERRPMTMCTLNHDGSIHAVAMWYGFLGGSIAIETKAKAQKAVNLGRDPRLTCMFEDGDYYEELRGVELVGRAEIVEDPEQMWELGVNLFERYYGAYSEELADGRDDAQQAHRGQAPRRAHRVVGPSKARAPPDAPHLTGRRCRTAQGGAATAPRRSHHRTSRTDKSNGRGGTDRWN